MDSARTAVRPLIAGPDDRRTPEVGRRARLELAFGHRDGRTVLGRTYAEPPLRVSRTFDEGNQLHAILTSSAPGIFGGDTIAQSFELEPGARVRLRSQSALQVHPARDGSPAALRSVYRVGAGAHLSCEWDPVIPFADARLDQQIRIDLEADASLVWSDAVMSGREARGERWMFSRLSHELQCCRGGRLVYLERYALEPSAGGIGRAWVAGDASYFGTVLIIGGRATPIDAANLHQELNAIQSVRAGVDTLESDVLLIRILSASGPSFHRARALCARVSIGSSAEGA